MTEQYARYTNEAHTSGIFVRPDGSEIAGPLPPNAGDILAEFNAFLEGGGVVERYAAPPVPVPATISDRQFFQQLAVVGIITEAQALASNAAVIPQPLLDIINKMPADQQFGVKMLVSGATTFERDNPVTIAIGTAYGMSSEQIDAFFTAAAAL